MLEFIRVARCALRVSIGITSLFELLTRNSKSFFMFARGLKAKMAMNIVILLVMAMILINLVIMVTTQRDLIRAEISKGEMVLARLEEHALAANLWEDIGSHSESKARIRKILDEAGINCALIMGKNSGRLYFGENLATHDKDLTNVTRQATLSGEKVMNFSGRVWAVFWKQHRNVIISVPLIQDGKTVAGASIVLPLEGVYESLRNSQKLIVIYILINAIILASAGIYRLSKVYFQPLARLANRAEDYRDDDEEFIFTVRKADNELNTLSTALNSMLRRISADKEKLRSTVLSLEKANLDLKKAQEEIVRAEKLASVGRLSAGIAHEIGNPIGIVMGYLDLIKQPDVPISERNEYIDRTGKEIERINTIIRQLLEISRPSKADRSEVSVHDLIDDISDVLNVQPLMSDIELQRCLNAEKDMVKADPNQLRQVFLNLIINAADAISALDGDNNGHKGGRLAITTEIQLNTQFSAVATGSMLKVLFSDNGPGIPDENLPNIFDPFFTTKDPGKGTGLGLSVSFMIVESLGGKMTVESMPGEGTTMIILLPLCEAGQG
jgi:signal transduction histidine kinase